MSDNRNYSVITNFGCHWQCPYCIVRNTGIQIAETRMGATYDTVMDLADSGKMKFLSFSGGGDPLWGLDIRRAYWYGMKRRYPYRRFSSSQRTSHSSATNSRTAREHTGLSS
jgi:hypothetical protein